MADSFYGEDWGFKEALQELGTGYVLALKPSHAWWHKVGEIGSPWAAAVAAGEGWEDESNPGDWVKVVRHFRDGHEQAWWALEVDVGPYGPERTWRSVVASTNPKELPDRATWYLTTNLPAAGSKQASDSELEAADLAEIFCLYGLRMWVEQSYKQIKHVLGWSDYQVRGDIAIRRHWQLVCCAFAFCWWAYGHMPASLEQPSETNNDLAADSAEREKRRALVSWPQTLRAVRAWLEPYIMLMQYWRAFSGMPPPKELTALLEWVFSGRGIYLYAR